MRGIYILKNSDGSFHCQYLAIGNIQMPAEEKEINRVGSDYIEMNKFHY